MDRPYVLDGKIRPKAAGPGSPQGNPEPGAARVPRQDDRFHLNGFIRRHHFRNRKELLHRDFRGREPFEIRQRQQGVDTMQKSSECFRPGQATRSPWQRRGLV